MGYQTLACPESFAGTNIRTMEEEVNRRVEAYKSVLLPSYEERKNKGVSSKRNSIMSYHDAILFLVNTATDLCK